MSPNNNTSQFFIRKKRGSKTVLKKAPKALEKRKAHGVNHQNPGANTPKKITVKRGFGLKKQN